MSLPPLPRRRAATGRAAVGARRALALLVALIVLFGGAPARAQSPTEATAAELERIAALIEAGDEAGARAALVALEQAAPLDAEPWLRQLDERPATVAGQLRRAAELLRVPPTELPEDAATRLQAIVDRLGAPAVVPPWIRFLDWLAQLLDRWFGDLVDAAMPFMGLLRLLIVCIVVPIASAMLFWLWRALLRLRSRQRSIPTLIEGEVPVHATAAQEQAGLAAQAGDYREAIRLLYLAALLHLDEVGRLRFDRALTNREVLASTRGDAALQSLLTPVVTQFDRVWYGHAPFGADDFALMESQLIHLRQMEGAR